MENVSENLKTITCQKSTLEEEGMKIKTQLDDSIKVCSCHLRHYFINRGEVKILWILSYRKHISYISYYINRFVHVKTSDKRKKLLDEMAIQLQTKSDEITKTKDEMKEQTTTLESELQVSIKIL